MSTTHPQRIRWVLAIAFALSTLVFIAQPARADFTPPNTPKLTKSVEITAPTGAVKAFYDSTNDVIHVLGTDTLTTYDANTLEVKASMVLSSGETLSQFGNAFDPEHSIIFATLQNSSGSHLEAWEYLPADGTYALSDVNIPAYRTVVYSAALDRVYSIETGDGLVDPTVAAATRDPDTTAWVPGPSYPNIDIGVGNTSVLEIAATADGTLVGTYATTGSGTGPDDQQVTRKPIYSFADTGSELVPTEIPGTQLAPATIAYPTSLPIGYKDFTPKSGGSITATEFAESSSHQMITLDPSGANSSGFEVNATTVALDFQPKFTDFDSNGDLYLSSSDTLSLYRDGTLFAASDAGPTVRDMTGGNGSLYAITGSSSPYKLAAMSIGGYSPTITADPVDRSVTVSGASDSKSVTLNSDASGTPAPTARWQKLPAGSLIWSDIPGATSPDFTFGATAADNGASYRAVYANVAGEIATASALLTVTVDAPAPPALPVGPPAPAAPIIQNGKSVKLKIKKGKSARVTVGTVTCGSASTCVYTLPKTITFKIGTKSYKAKVAGPASLEPGKSRAIYATVPASAVKALKGKKSKLIVGVQVANSAGVKFPTAKNAIENIRG
jgi:hypothetical protein